MLSLRYSRLAFSFFNIRLNGKRWKLLFVAARSPTWIYQVEALTQIFNIVVLEHSEHGTALEKLTGLRHVARFDAVILCNDGLAYAKQVHYATRICRVISNSLENYADDRNYLSKTRREPSNKRNYSLLEANPITLLQFWERFRSHVNLSFCKCTNSFP